MSAALEFRNVTVAIGGGRRLLESVSLEVEEGTVTVILGRSGSGKTTLLRTANRMVEPTDGEIIVTRSTRDEVVALRRKMGYVIQETGLFPHFTLERNVGIVLEVQGIERQQRIERSNELLRLVGLDPEAFSGRYPHQLSGGQRQRVGLARALAANPKILLMDEPFGALDPLTRVEMQDMLLDEALYLADRIVLLSEGRMVANLARDEFPVSQIPEVLAYMRAFHRRRGGGAKRDLT